MMHGNINIKKKTKSNITVKVRQRTFSHLLCSHTHGIIKNKTLKS